MDGPRAVRFRHWFQKHWPLLAILLATTLLRLSLLTMPFGRNGDGTGSFYGILARNYLLRDNSQTLFQPVLSVGIQNNPPTLYAHHPPTVPLFTAASIALFGDTDFAVRLPAFLFTLASIAALYLLTLPRLGRPGAAAAAMLLAFVPLSLRFGQMPDVINSQLIFAALLITAAYLNLIAAPRWTSLLLLVLALLFGFATDWPAFFLVPILVIHLALTRPSRWLLHAATLAILATLSFAALYTWISLATHNWSLVLHQFLNRSTQTQTDNNLIFSWSSWCSGVWAYNHTLHTIPLLALAAVGLLAALFCKPHRPNRPLVCIIAAWATVHVLVGRQATLNHDWWWWPMTLALCLSAASLISLVARTRATTLVCFSLLTSLCAWWSITELRNLHSSHWLLGDIPQYSPRDLGYAARAAAPPGRAILLFDTDEQPYLIYNADRPIIQKVWTESDFHSALAAREAYLFYSFTQPLASPPAAMLIPTIYEPKATQILPFLRKTYPEHTSGPFLIFDLDHPLSSQTPAQDKVQPPR